MAYDVIVVGLGAMGVSTALHLARRGARVLGLERYDIPHAMGSSHGTNRIIRLAYFEHPSYVPLLRRAYELWRELEQQAGEPLLFVTGGVDAGPPESPLVRGSLESCRVHGLAHEVVSAAELGARHPGYQIPSHHIAVLQPDAGFVMSERAIVASAELALAHGADLRAREPVLGWEPTSGGVRVRTTRGTHEAERLVLATGPWIGEHVPALAGKAVPERQVLGWFQPKVPAHYRLGAFPVGIVDLEDGTFTYQFPAHGVPGFKLGVYHHRYESGPIDTLSREPDDADEALLRRALRTCFADADGATLALRVCFFTNVADGHFVIDTLPGLPQVLVASPCSGHGFKFASVVGEALAELATKGATRHDLSLFRLDRLG